MFSKFAGTSMFPNSKKRNKFRLFLFNFICQLKCKLNKHDLQKCRIDNIDYRFCKYCEYTERSACSGWIKVDRLYDKEVDFE